MGLIKLLDDKTINKIAAGEVIEKPASITKELVENSMDAGATDITVEVRGGGISFLRIIDNGYGIERDDMEIAFLRHATSKINDDKDLNKISTLGFRGEALASISAVSKVEMMSKKKESSIGHKILIEGGKIISKEECGCPDGTIITIKDVFFNTPARLKFLKSESREGAYITDLMQNMAISHANISFKYKLNDKLVFLTKGDGDLKSVLMAVYGKNIIKNIIPINHTIDFITAKGFIGNSEIAKGNRNHQSIFINGRYIKNKTITAAVEAAYKSMLTINKFPFFVLHLYINPEFIDVNVHPSKAEVKFQDDQMVFKAVYHAVKNALLPLSSIEDNTEHKSSFIADIPKLQYSQQSMDMPVNTMKYEAKISANREEILREEASEIFQEQKISESKASEPIIIKESFTNDTKPLYVNKMENSPIVEKNNNLINKTPKFGPLSIIGQFHFSYILAEGPDELYIIDQHAAHERLYYEKYLQQFQNFGIQSQNLIVPIVVDLSISEKQIILENIDAFHKLGYEIDDFGGNSLSLRSVPVIYGNPDPRDLFNEIQSQIDEKSKTLLAVIDKIIYTMACKSAVKAGDKLSYSEMAELIEKLRYCDNPFNCPHGRPTIIKMTHYELDKKFKRIL